MGRPDPIRLLHFMHSVGVIVALGLAATAARADSGDVNGDGRVDQGDIQLIDDYLGGSLLLQDNQIAAADADGDGKITPTDRELLRRRLALAVGPTAPVSGRTPAAPATPRTQIDLTSANSGVVVDRATGQPLADVEVALPDEGITVRTDSQGRFKLPRLAPGKILTARATDYAPSAVTSQDVPRSFRLELDRLSPRIAVLDDRVHHLGDDKYGYGSANNQDFRLKAEGPRLVHRFMIDGTPRNGFVLHIGSIIGLDTAHSVAAGQSALGQFAQSDPDGLRIYLNGRPLQKIYLNSDNISIALPVQMLRQGSNELRLETHPLRLPPGADPDLERLRTQYGLVNYDDIELAHLLIVDTSPDGRTRVRAEIVPSTANR